MKPVIILTAPLFPILSTSEICVLRSQPILISACTVSARSCFTLVNAVFRASVIRDPNFNIALYNSLIESKIAYCSPVWRPHLKNHVKLLDTVSGVPRGRHFPSFRAFFSCLACCFKLGGAAFCEIRVFRPRRHLTAVRPWILYALDLRGGSSGDVILHVIPCVLLLTCLTVPICDLKSAGLIDHYIDIVLNRLRSRFTFSTKQVAKAEIVNQQFAWRVVRQLQG